MTDEIPLDDALLQLREFLNEETPVNFLFRFGGNGADFDNTILRRWYERQGSLPVGVTPTIAMYAQSLSWGSHQLRCQNGYSIRRSAP
ncbi:hypothetical protein ACNKHP_22700 [Shigella boydii]